MYTLSCPAPRRQWSLLPSGKWYSHSWNLQGVKECLAGGGWFGSDHDFDGPIAAIAARKKVKHSKFKLPALTHNAIAAIHDELMKEIS